MLFVRCVCCFIVLCLACFGVLFVFLACLFDAVCPPRAFVLRLFVFVRFLIVFFSKTVLQYLLGVLVCCCLS